MKYFVIKHILYFSSIFIIVCYQFLFKNLILYQHINIFIINLIFTFNHKYGFWTICVFLVFWIHFNEMLLHFYKNICAYFISLRIFSSQKIFKCVVYLFIAYLLSVVFSCLIYI